MIQELIYTLFLLFPAAASTDMPKTALPTPPGTVYLEKNLFVDRAEITNMHWNGYLHALKRDSTREAYLQALPDTSLWDSVDNTGNLKKNYLRSIRFRYYPVVGITYEQAVAFSSWRSVVSTESYNKYNNRSLTQRNVKERYKVIFTWRLPSVEEWEKAAAGGLDPETYPYGLKVKNFFTSVNPNHQIIDSLGYARPELRKELKYHLRYNPYPNFNCINSFGKGFRYGFFQPHHTPIFFDNHRPLTANRPNKLQIYDAVGNVAEMTSIKGIAKGGSWAHLMQYATIKQTQKYDQPKVWLGLRGICEVTKERVSDETAKLLASPDRLN
ncbi:SUMF1/EgtB/PvdO family nonheme iron enzyme [Pontibacter qinzhouensis]|uniref:SUMF1/EgtB/PvdO family nonheme iron enzyme n=1 Tax=Pontibacter qinzhouensis TaxID=2603253 RepID=A0A5C8KA78_9BACT|nr:SUMF1/EgtB/PvdO family nonheme iron enzyme [Pontibacter qinzhouensis]TXK45756.1 SUMF1/EgtB/PvdO family nonheme iron enzyme [Pontibacter qinzhouensis]